MMRTNATERPPSRPTVMFRTQALEDWGRIISQQFLPLQADERKIPEHFEGRSVVARFCDSVVADIHVSAHKVMRTRRMVADDKARYFKICWQLAGYNQLEQGGRSVTVRPGQWAIYDTSQPYTFETSEAAHFMMLLVPQSEVSHWTPWIDQVTAAALPGLGTAEVARTAMSGMLIDGIVLDVDSQLVVQDSILSLMSAAVRQVSAAAEGGPSLVQKKLQAALAYIEANLTDQDLSADAVALACGISRRSLYTAFDSIGQTPHAYIMSQRLALARQLLGQRGGATRLVTEVAYELGFSDAAHFSRAFHERFKLSPSQWRAGQRDLS